ncbi:hypothetical protein CBER1_04907 [Cercospora berteroae]|uniref:Uncharacterized protein n=1 Tax=Cercospora berteroae TaxID=357750 RepID=A0A2S6BS48_9PEZI|nr:hypothetical protein CBER1_04907 [Cercospora berteroae]
MAATAATSAWLARTQKRQHGEMGMFIRRPSEAKSTGSSNSTVTNSTHYTDATDATCSPPHSSVSSTNSSIPESFEKLQALQTQVQKNNAQIAANEERMREIMCRDDERGEILSQRLAEVSRLNRQLDLLSALFARADQAVHGEYHAGLSN